LRRFWYYLKDLLKGFWWLFRLLKSVEFSWSYGLNEVYDKIKEEDKWKAAFTTLIELFEPTVMFFGLTNSPATFQAMINNLLRDLINKGNIVSFIDDVLVATEMEKEYDKIAKEVLRHMEENDLYVKPEKYI